MSDEQNGKATIALVYKVMGELRTELREQIGDLDTRMESRFDALLLAINDLRDGMVSCGVCDERHHASAAALEAAVKNSEDDREKLWDAMHDVQRQLKWAAASVIGAVIIGIISAYFG